MDIGLIIWAKELSKVLREGVHQVQIDLAGVKYMSSAGIGMLVAFYKQFKAIQGSFAVVNASAPVRTLLNLTKLASLLRKVERLTPVATVLCRYAAESFSVGRKSAKLFMPFLG